MKLKKKIIKNNSINRDTGEFGLNSIYNNLLRSNKVNIISPESFDLCLPDMSDESNEPEPKRPRRFASAAALKKKSNKLYVISLLGINFVCTMSFSFTADDGHMCIYVYMCTYTYVYMCSKYP